MERRRTGVSGRLRVTMLAILVLVSTGLAPTAAADISGGATSGGGDGKVVVTDRSPGSPGSSKSSRSPDGSVANSVANPCASAANGAACQLDLTDDQFTPAEGVFFFTISAATAAQIAVAELQLPTPTPHIGPDPSINPWNMAAVGYPLWLWTDGPTQVGPVSQAVSNLFVALDAELAGVSYDMGDGHTVHCSGPGEPWTRAVSPGTASRCGHTYQRPSLPGGEYRVRATAHWNVTWTIGTNSGTLTVDREATSSLPVGELQALVR